METCYRHPDRETGVSCSNCGRPICPDCMTTTSVGMRCPECARQRTRVRQYSGGAVDQPTLTYVLIGVNVSIHDANFHHLDPSLRHVANDPEPASVRIEDNVWIGDNVKVLKGVTIGANSVIGNGSIVSRSVPAGVVAAGVPARVIRNL